MMTEGSREPNGKEIRGQVAYLGPQKFAWVTALVVFEMKDYVDGFVLTSYFPP